MAVGADDKPRLAGKRITIMTLETLAVLLTFVFYGSSLNKFFVYVFTDNSGALAALLKGSSACVISEKLVELLYDKYLFSPVWYCWIASRRNIGDCVTRVHRFKLITAVLDIRIKQGIETDHIKKFAIKALLS